MRIMIKLVASDIDGTLITGHQPISQINKETIKKAISQGIIFTIVSGRGIDDILPIVKDIPCHIISGNGAEYYDEKGQLLLSYYMNKEECIQVSQVMQEVGLMHMIYTSQGTITPMNVEDVRKAFINRHIAIDGGNFQKDYNHFMSEYKPFAELKHVDDIAPFIDNVQVIKVEGFEVGDEMIKEVKKRLSHQSHIYVSSSFFNNVEVMDKRATKGNILHKVIQMMNIKPHEVMVIGDGLNDMTLFQDFKYTVAVENAVPQIKDIAKYHVASAKHNGVAQAIKTYVLSTH